ncbi:MAG: molecular chaperone TorD family protein, partial [Candidatus Rokubacteria bacterium]|nr:molecular chaperone TorD family protein [Candidatus Rokubacteria bacterium]
MIGDRDLLEFRRTYYDLLVAFFWREPMVELLGPLREGIEERTRAASRLHPLLGQGWEEIGGFLAGRAPEAAAEAAADEFTRLFLGPTAPEVHSYESYYLTGKLLDRPLVAIRSYLKSIGMEREESYPEPEDALAFELGVMRRLIDRQATESNPDGETRWVNVQATFLKLHLLVWAPTCARDMEEAKGARLYRGVARLLRGFLDLELDRVRDWGPVALRSLEEARQGYLGAGEWKGPLFEVPPG